MIVYGNIVYTIGSILVAAAVTVKSFNFMIAGRVILAIGDISTQIAQYKMFSSWFPPSNGFASTLGLELSIGKVGESSGSKETEDKEVNFFFFYFRLVVLLALQRPILSQGQGKWTTSAS